MMNGHLPVNSVYLKNINNDRITTGKRCPNCYTRLCGHAKNNGAKHVGSGVLLINGENTILGKQVAGANIGYYNIGCGRRKPGECCIMTAYRELIEELKVDITLKQFLNKCFGIIVINISAIFILEYDINNVHELDQKVKDDLINNDLIDDLKEVCKVKLFNIKKCMTDQYKNKISEFTLNVITKYYEHNYFTWNLPYCDTNFNYDFICCHNICKYINIDVRVIIITKQDNIPYVVSVPNKKKTIYNLPIFTIYHKICIKSKCRLLMLNDLDIILAGKNKDMVIDVDGKNIIVSIWTMPTLPYNAFDISDPNFNRNYKLSRLEVAGTNTPVTETGTEETETEATETKYKLSEHSIQILNIIQNIYPNIAKIF